jgi:DNA-binding MarR family transcriptional regulator
VRASRAEGDASEAVKGSRECIGIDDAFAGSYPGYMDDAARDAAARFAELFPQLYLRLHARKRRSQTRVTSQMWAMLQHLAAAGPLTVTECAEHFGRAQSVVSETVDALEAKGLLERMRDERDRRRTFVWLTDEARAFMEKERRVLDDERLSRAMARLRAEQRTQLLVALESLVRACDDDARAPERLDAPRIEVRCSTRTMKSTKEKRR